MSNSGSVASALMQQYNRQRRNLLFVCRLSVKNLIDKACMEAIDETSEELQTFCIIMEHILCHRIKPQQKWYGGIEVRSFWEYVKAACSEVTHNCLKNIKSLEKPKTSQGKGRAWLRMALMEKRLSDYLSAALQQSRLTRAFYAEGSIMLTEEIQVLAGVLLGLNAIDFSFDIRSEDLDQPFMPVIDFTPYLKFIQVEEKRREDVDLQELSEMSTSVVSDVFGDDDPTDTWPNRFSRLDNKYRLVVEQKGYLEELVRLRESQLTEMHGQKQKLIEAMQHYESESRKDRQQLESVIIELQAQMSQMKEEQWTQREKLQNVVVHYQTDPPNASFHSSGDVPHITGSQMVGDVQNSEQDLSQKTASLNSPKASTSHLEAGGSKSVLSSTSTVSAITVPGGSDDSHSMIPLAGSFTSETSFKSGEVAAQINTISSKQVEGQLTGNGQSTKLKNDSESHSLHHKQISAEEESKINEQGDRSSEQSSQTTRKSSPDSKSKCEDTSSDIKKHLDPEKQEQEGMEKADEEKPIQT